MSLGAPTGLAQRVEMEVGVRVARRKLGHGLGEAGWGWRGFLGEFGRVGSPVSRSGWARDAQRVRGHIAWWGQSPDGKGSRGGYGARESRRGVRLGPIPLREAQG